jgi:hypothetical protein
VRDKRSKEISGEWYRALSAAQMLKVLKWLEKHPPPDDWKFTRLDWAYLECDDWQ